MEYKHPDVLYYRIAVYLKHTVIAKKHACTDSVIKFQVCRLVYVKLTTMLEELTHVYSTATLP